jgi:hypothetical protein
MDDACAAKRRWSSARGGRRIRDRAGQPGIPTLGRVFGIELEIRFQAKEALLEYECQQFHDLRNRSVDVGARGFRDRSHLHSQLTAEDRRGKCATRNDKREIRGGVQTRIEIDVQRRIEPAHLDLARYGNIGPGVNSRMIVN